MYTMYLEGIVNDARTSAPLLVSICDFVLRQETSDDSHRKRSMNKRCKVVGYSVRHSVVHRYRRYRIDKSNRRTLNRRRRVHLKLNNEKDEY
jgi:hypothetical protein